MDGWFGLRLEGRTSKDPRPASRGDRIRVRLRQRAALDWIGLLASGITLSLNLTV